MNGRSMVTDGRILIVDDEESVVLLLERMLHQDGYTNVVSTTDPRQALPLFETFRPDLLLLDVMMPYLDGFGVLEELKPRMRGSRVPTMIITADVSGDVKRRALVAGVDDFVTKPFSVNEVLMRVRYLLETRIRRLAAQEQELQVIHKAPRPGLNATARGGGAAGRSPAVSPTSGTASRCSARTGSGAPPAATGAAPAGGPVRSRRTPGPGPASPDRGPRPTGPA